MFKILSIFILLFGDISLKTGPSPYLQDDGNKIESFHFLHFNADNFGLKIDEITVGRTKSAKLRLLNENSMLCF